MTQQGRNRADQAGVNKVQTAYATYLCDAIAASRNSAEKRELVAKLKAFERTRGDGRPTPKAKRKRLVDGFVYFLGGADTPIKIGFSTSPSDRMAILQTAHWGRLEILAVTPGTIELEARYHAHFASLRLHGEWFKRNRRILAEIRRINSTPVPHAPAEVVARAMAA